MSFSLPYGLLSDMLEIAWVPMLFYAVFVAYVLWSDKKAKEESFYLARAQLMLDGTNIMKSDPLPIDLMEQWREGVVMELTNRLGSHKAEEFLALVDMQSVRASPALEEELHQALAKMLNYLSLIDLECLRKPPADERVDGAQLRIRGALL
jgi:hypothetical protein